MSHLRAVPPGATGYTEDTSVELVQPFSRRRMRLSRSAALDLIYGGRDGPAAAATREADPPPDAASHWNERNWSWSLPYYLFSRGVRFADADDDGSWTVRRAILTEYAQHSSPPTPTACTGNRLPLPRPAPDSERSAGLGEVLSRRRSMLRPPQRALELDDFGHLLWTGLHRVRHSLAIAERHSKDIASVLISLGSAFDFYVVAYDVTSLSPGVYRYLPLGHHLVCVRSIPDATQLRRDMRQVLIGQPAPLTAAATLAIVVDFERYQWRYRHERALRLLYVAAGQIMGHLVVAATACQKRTQLTPAADDYTACGLFELDPARHQLLYSLNLS
jgi:SagB-type dehydrogenase family enzyme